MPTFAVPKQKECLTAKIKITMAKINGNITTYKGRYCAELESGEYMLSSGSMEMILCEKVSQGFKVKKAGIVGGIMMRTEDDFKWCVENYNA